MEKSLLEPELHSAYDSIFAVNPAMKISLIKQDISQIYEDIMRVIEEPTFCITLFVIENQLLEKIKSQSLAMSHKVFLQKVEEVEITELTHAGKMMNVVAKVTSKQLAYKEDEAGNVIEGSKITPISTTETLFVSRAVNGLGMWFLADVK